MNREFERKVLKQLKEISDRIIERDKELLEELGKE